MLLYIPGFWWFKYNLCIEINGVKMHTSGQLLKHEELAHTPTKPDKRLNKKKENFKNKT
jgi:hypothetical protein